MHKINGHLNQCMMHKVAQNSAVEAIYNYCWSALENQHGNSPPQKICTNSFFFFFSKHSTATEALRTDILALL